MNVVGLSLRAIKVYLAMTRRLLSTSQYQNLLEHVARLALKQMGIGTTHDMSRNGEVALLNSLPTHCCVIDVGAHSGAFARAVKGLRPAASIHCFEPLPELFGELQSLEGVTANNSALSDRAGEATLYGDASNPELSSLYFRRLDHFGLRLTPRGKVPVDTLDAYAQRVGLPCVDLLKIDVEGHELAVLRGATQLLQRRAIKRVLFEFGGADIDSRTFLQDFFYFLAQFGLGLHRLLPDGYLHPIPRYDELYEQFAYSNFVALLNSLELPGSPPSALSKLPQPMG